MRSTAKMSRRTLLAAVLVPCCLTTMAHAGGFAIPDQSASAAARATVGLAAGLMDASTTFYNPATLTLLGRQEIQIGLGAGFPRYSYADSGSTDAVGGPMRGGTSTDMDTWLVPDVFAVWPVGQRFWAGLAVTSPFGESTGYDPGWVGRYFVTKVKLQTVDVGLVLAGKIAGGWSLGGGVDWQYARLTRTSAVDFGSICFGTIGPAICPSLGLLPQAADGQAALSGNSNAWGYNVGLLYSVPETLRLGLSYRSKVSHDFRGTATFAVPAVAAPLLAAGAFQDTGASTSLVFPESASLGVAYEATQNVTLYGSLTWTRWSSIDRFLVQFDNPAQPPQLETLGWNDSVRGGLALDYRLSPGVTLSSGVAYDPSPIPADRRQAFLPESDKLIFGAGATWSPTTNAYVIVSYSCYFQRDATIEQSAAAAGTLRGTYSNRVQGLGLSAGIRF
jgi:long-chain fatty acid transport protein